MDIKLEAILDQVYAQSQIEFGAAVESRWLYAKRSCPGCRI